MPRRQDSGSLFIHLASCGWITSHQHDFAYHRTIRDESGDENVRTLDPVCFSKVRLRIESGEHLTGLDPTDERLRSHADGSTVRVKVDARPTRRRTVTELFAASLDECSASSILIRWLSLQAMRPQRRLRQRALIDIAAERTRQVLPAGTRGRTARMSTRCACCTKFDSERRPPYVSRTATAVRPQAGA